VPIIAVDPGPRAARVSLPRGVWRDAAAGAPLTEVALRAVDGEDEAFLLDARESMLPSERATALLARCMPGHGELAPELAVGDREALLLHLRRLTLGETMDCVLACPAPVCAERMEIALAVDDLLLPPYADREPEYALVIDADAARHDVTFRLPVAADLDGAAALARRDPLAAERDLLRRCVLRAERNGVACAVDAMPPAVREAIGAAMAEHDPQAELTLDLACPACGFEFAVVFDSAAFFLQELDARATGLLHEVHALALAYGWSEREILRMPRQRRARYLALIADAPARAGHR
jgi:hypothetical protein